MDDYKVAVIGSRSFSDRDLMKNELTDLIKTRNVEKESVVIISGGARGADSLAESIADEMGFRKNIMKADWQNLSVPNVRKKINGWGGIYNANAGHDRNKKMADECDEAVAFWDGTSPGTKNMVGQVRMLGKPVKLVRY